MMTSWRGLVNPLVEVRSYTRDVYNAANARPEYRSLNNQPQPQHHLVAASHKLAFHPDPPNSASFRKETKFTSPAHATSSTVHSAGGVQLLTSALLTPQKAASLAHIRVETTRA